MSDGDLSLRISLNDHSNLSSHPEEHLQSVSQNFAECSHLYQPHPGQFTPFTAKDRAGSFLPLYEPQTLWDNVLKDINRILDSSGKKERPKKGFGSQDWSLISSDRADWSRWFQHESSGSTVTANLVAQEDVQEEQMVVVPTVMDERLLAKGQETDAFYGMVGMLPRIENNSPKRSLEPEKTLAEENCPLPSPPTNLGCDSIGHELSKGPKRKKQKTNSQQSPPSNQRTLIQDVVLPTTRRGIGPGQPTSTGASHSLGSGVWKKLTNNGNQYREEASRQWAARVMLALKINAEECTKEDLGKYMNDHTEALQESKSDDQRPLLQRLSALTDLSDGIELWKMGCLVRLGLEFYDLHKGVKSKQDIYKEWSDRYGVKKELVKALCGEAEILLYLVQAGSIHITYLLLKNDLWKTIKKQTVFRLFYELGNMLLSPHEDDDPSISHARNVIVEGIKYMSSQTQIYVLRGVGIDWNNLVECDSILKNCVKANYFHLRKRSDVWPSRLGPVVETERREGPEMTNWGNSVSSNLASTSSDSGDSGSGNSWSSRRFKCEIVHCPITNKEGKYSEKIWASKTEHQRALASNATRIKDISELNEWYKGPGSQTGMSNNKEYVWISSEMIARNHLQIVSPQGVEIMVLAAETVPREKKDLYENVALCFSKRYSEPFNSQVANYSRGAVHWSVYHRYGERGDGAPAGIPGELLMKTKTKTRGNKASVAQRLPYPSREALSAKAIMSELKPIMDKFLAPVLEEVKEYFPDEWKILMECADRIPGGHVLFGWPFTGAVVNFGQEERPWEGGAICFPELGLVIELQSCQTIAFRAHRQPHFNLHARGRRNSLVLSTEEAIVKNIADRNGWVNHVQTGEEDSGSVSRIHGRPSKDSFLGNIVHMAIYLSFQQNLYIKYLPYTIQAANGVFYTEIFSVAFWKEQPKGTLFVTVLQNRAVQRKMRPSLSILLKKCGRILDQIEDDLRFNRKFRSKAGLGSFKARTSLPKGHSTTWLFLMLFTDRILWANSGDPIPQNVQLHEHPHSQSYKKSSRVDIFTEEMYLGSDNVNQKDVVQDFLSSIDDMAENLLDGDEQESNMVLLNQEISNSGDHLPIGDENYKMHSGIIWYSVRLQARAHVTNVAGNCFWLASSAEFLLRSLDDDYVTNFHQLLPTLLDSKTSPNLKFPVCMALANSPVFILNSRCCLQKFHQSNKFPTMNKLTEGTQVVSQMIGKTVRDSISTVNFEVHFTRELRARRLENSQVLTASHSTKASILPPLAAPQVLSSDEDDSPTDALTPRDEPSPPGIPSPSIPSPNVPSPNVPSPNVPSPGLPSPTLQECENPTALPAPDDDGDGVSPAVEEDQDMDVESEKDIPSTVEDVEWEEQQPEGPTALPAPNDDGAPPSVPSTPLTPPHHAPSPSNNVSSPPCASPRDSSALRESENPTALSTPNDDDNGVGSAVKEHQDHHVGSEEDVPSTMQNTASEGELVEQLQSGQLSSPNTLAQQLELHLGKRKRDETDLDSTSELTALLDEEDNLEPSNNDAPQIGDDGQGTVLPKPSLHPRKRFKPHTSYTPRKVGYNWHLNINLKDLSESKLPESQCITGCGGQVQMKSGKKPGVESYVFKTFVNDGNGVYRSVEGKYELEWFEGLFLEYGLSTMSGTIPMDCTCFPASWLEAVMDNDESMDILLEKVSIFSDRVIMIPNPKRRHDFFKDRLHKSFDIRRLALHQGVDIHMGREFMLFTSVRKVIGELTFFDGKRKAMNFLDIPTAVSLRPPDILPWRLCATEGALSRAHIDAGKFGTWIHMVHGTKLWVVISGDIVETSLEDLDYTAHKWTYYLLEPGDQLLPPPLWF
ncbi:hypothetical protein BU17DRAFT_72377 [Hysterangium stoloniferum]|nr:hypothetical protein BU17DRAFT_72377 [Hysterangium stoloniferum]